MILQFLKTRIGAALIAAIVLIICASALKLSLSRSSGTDDLDKKVALIAASGIKEALKSGSLAQNQLEAISGTTTAIADLTSSTTDSASSENITATDRFARELFTRYSEAKQGGQQIDQNTQLDIANSVLSQDYSTERKLISKSDLKISANMSLSAIKTYGNSLGKALSVPPVKGDNELVILERVRDQGLNDDDARTLGLILQRYRNMADSLMKMTVPEGAAAAHIDLVNGINLLGDVTDGILAMLTDPVGGLGKIKHYQDAVNLVTAGSLGMRDYFKSKNITYSSSESGYGFTQ